MVNSLFILGALIFGVLGAFHLFYTLFSNKFDAFDPSVTEAMKSTSPVLTKETTMWRAWVGFNASHSIGALLIPAFYIPVAAFHADLLLQSFWLSILPTLIGICYLILAKNYWFKIPFIGVAVATLLFALAALLINT
ncbi:MAG: hypothetical protein AAF699_08855 [Pseudomonadota bacterium]